MIKRILIAIGLMSLVAIVAVAAHLLWYHANLQLRLVCVCTLDDAKVKYPQIGDWIANHKPWEWVPSAIASAIYPERVPDDEVVFAFYERRITKFAPCCFHAAKGTLECEDGDKGTFYVYVWRLRYYKNAAG